MHCKTLLTLPRKTKLKLRSRTIAGTGSHRTVHAQRHLTNYCNPDGRASISQLLEAKIKIKEENEEAVKLKAEKDQEEVTSGNKRKRKKEHQPKIHSAVSHQDKRNAAMTQ